MTEAQLHGLFVLGYYCIIITGLAVTILLLLAWASQDQ